MKVLDRFTQVLFDDEYQKDNLAMAAFTARTVIAFIIILFIVDIYHVLNIMGLVHFSNIAPEFSRDSVTVAFLIGTRISVEILTKNNLGLVKAVSKDKGKLWHRDLNLAHGALLTGMFFYVVLGAS